MLGTDRPHVLREAILCCRKGGTISIPGVYIGYLDQIPFGAAMNKGLTMKMGQTHVHRYLPLLMQAIEGGHICLSHFRRQGRWLHQSRVEALIRSRGAVP